MQESARAAVSHIRANAAALGIAPDFLDHRDLHVHVPAGAIPEGRSVGRRHDGHGDPLGGHADAPVRDDVAMTGEITLSGLVLPVGGIREKALAARRLGIKTFILPALNEPDLDEIPPDLRSDMSFVFARRWRTCWRRRAAGGRAGPDGERVSRPAPRLLHLGPRLRARLALDRGRQRRARAPAVAAGAHPHRRRRGGCSI